MVLASGGSAELVDYEDSVPQIIVRLSLLLLSFKSRASSGIISSGGGGLCYGLGAT